MINFIVILLLNVCAKTNIYETTILFNTDDNYAVGSVNNDEYTGTSNTIYLANTNKTISDYLDTDTSIDIRRSGALGSISTVSIRGSSPSQVNIYLDGVLLNTASSPFFDLSNIDISSIKKIEIYKGSIPINLGTGSIGGAINLVSKNDKKQKLLSFKFNSLKHLEGTALYSNKRLLLSVNTLLSANNFYFLNDNGTDFNTTDDKYEERYYNEVLQNSILFKYNLINNSQFKLYPRISYFKKLQHLPTWNNLENPQTGLGTETVLATINTEYTGILSNKAQIAFQLHNERYQDKLGLIGLGTQDNSYKNTILSYKHYFEYIINSNNILKANIYTKKETYNTSNNLTASKTDSINRYGLSPAMELYSKLAFIKLNPSIIYEHYTDTNNTTNKYYDIFEPRLGIKAEFNNIQLFTNLGKYFRIPNFYELFGDRGFIVGNSNLLAEQSINFDIGTSFKFDLKQGLLSLYISYFASFVDNAISYVYDARGVGKAVNFSKATVKGVEGKVLYTHKNTKLIFDYTYKNPISDNKHLPGRFTHKLYIKVSHKLLYFTLWYSFIYESGMFYDSANMLESIPKFLHSLGVNYKYQNLFANFYVENILNKNYQDYHRYPTPGIVFNLSLGITI